MHHGIPFDRHLVLTMILQCSDTYTAARHLSFCFLFSLNNLPGCFNNKADVANFNSHVHQTILNNATIIACNNNQLCFLESLLIKRYCTYLNVTMALKLRRSLYCFSFRFNLSFSIFVILSSTSLPQLLVF